MDLTVTLTDDQLEEIAQRVAAILGERERPEAPSERLTVAQAAQMAGVAEKTVRNWLWEHKLTRFGGNRRPLVLRSELESLIDQKPARRARSPRKTRGRGARGPAGTFADLARSKSLPTYVRANLPA